MHTSANYYGQCPECGQPTCEGRFTCGHTPKTASAPCITNGTIGSVNDCVTFYQDPNNAEHWSTTPFISAATKVVGSKEYICTDPECFGDCHPIRKAKVVDSKEEQGEAVCEDGFWMSAHPHADRRKCTYQTYSVYECAGSGLANKKPCGWSANVLARHNPDDRREFEIEGRCPSCSGAIAMMRTIHIADVVRVTKIEEQDGEQEHSEEMCVCFCHEKGSPYCEDCMKDHVVAALKEESVAPPSLPMQEFEELKLECFGFLRSIDHFYDEEFTVENDSAQTALTNIRKLVNMPKWNASRAAAPVAPPTHQIVERTTQAGYASLRCSCGRIFVGLGDEALASARASFEAHLPEKEGK